jgi:hypothetical protein
MHQRTESADQAAVCASSVQDNHFQGGILGIESIQVDIHEGAEIGATRVMAYLGDTYVSEVNSTSMAVQTVTLPVTAGTFDTLVISGWETAVTGIRLIGATLVGNETQSLGVVKAMYR